MNIYLRSSQKRELYPSIMVKLNGYKVPCGPLNVQSGFQLINHPVKSTVHTQIRCLHTFTTPPSAPLLRCYSSVVVADMIFLHCFDCDILFAADAANIWCSLSLKVLCYFFSYDSLCAAIKHQLESGIAKPSVFCAVNFPELSIRNTGSKYW